MGKPIPHDIRLEMVRGITAGQSCRPVAIQFEVSPSTAVLLQARFAATGLVDPGRRGRPKGSGKLGPYQEVILDEVRARPDITMPELATWLAAAHGVTVDPSSLSKLLCQHGFAFKANTARTESERAEWRRR